MSQKKKNCRTSRDASFEILNGLDGTGDLYNWDNAKQVRGFSEGTEGVPCSCPDLLDRSSKGRGRSYGAPTSSWQMEDSLALGTRTLR
eukprot:scaffold2299_cov205-Pinguiococcus_pyrenoidosus.AAC.3